MSQEELRDTNGCWSVWFYQRVQRWDGDATLTRHAWMRFAPMAGLVIVFDEEQCDYATISRVEWLVNEDYFCAWCEPDDALTERNHPSDRCEPLEVAKKWYLSLGWEVLSETLIDKEDEKSIEKGKPGWREWRQRLVRGADCNFKRSGKRKNGNGKGRKTG